MTLRTPLRGCHCPLSPPPQMGGEREAEGCAQGHSDPGFRARSDAKPSPVSQHGVYMPREESRGRAPWTPPAYERGPDVCRASSRDGGRGPPPPCCGRSSVTVTFTGDAVGQQLVAHEAGADDPLPRVSALLFAGAATWNQSKSGQPGAKHPPQASGVSGSLWARQTPSGWTTHGTQAPQVGAHPLQRGTPPFPRGTPGIWPLHDPGTSPPTIRPAGQLTGAQRANLTGTDLYQLAKCSVTVLAAPQALRAPCPLLQPLPLAPGPPLPVSHTSLRVSNTACPVFLPWPAPHHPLQTSLSLPQEGLPHAPESFLGSVPSPPHPHLPPHLCAACHCTRATSFCDFTGSQLMPRPQGKLPNEPLEQTCPSRHAERSTKDKSSFIM